MSLAILDRFGLNERERKLVGVLALILGMGVLVGLPAGVQYWLSSKRSNVDEIRAALAEVQRSRAAVRERQVKKDAIVQRYQKRADALAGFLEQLASAQKLQVVDSVDRPEVPHGKRYSERHTIVHFKKVKMRPFARFLEAIEQSGQAVVLTRLNIRKRAGEPDQYDTEVGLSAFDRNEGKVATPEEGKEKTP
jgi:general secretion pathway protein M